MHRYKNPQENAILEIINQVVGSMLKTKDMANAMLDTVVPWIKILAYTVYAVWCSYHSTLQATTGQFVFGRNMLLEINFQPKYKEMWPRKQKLINYNNKRESAKWVECDYEVGNYAYILRDGNYRKL